MVLCDYCQQPAELVTGYEIYHGNFPPAHSKPFWRCGPCKAHVGCHAEGSWHMENGQKVVHGKAVPLGRLANAELRGLKTRAHAVFDPLWKTKKMSRSQAYAWLAKEMNVPVENAHIGQFNEQQCTQLIRLILHGAGSAPAAAPGSGRQQGVRA